MARPQQQQKKKSSNRKPHRKAQRKEERDKRRGPRLPSSLRRELHLQNPCDDENREDDEEENGERGRPAFSSDMYEYEENQAPEESHKNRRFDDVDRLEYELPSDFEDEEIDEGTADGEDPGGRNKRPKGKTHLAFGKKQSKGQQNDEEHVSDEEVSSESDDSDTYKQSLQDGSNEDENQSEDEDGELQGEEEEDVDGEQEESDIEAEEEDDKDDERHQRMIEAVRKSRTKEPREKRPKRVELLSEAYPESEFNINPSTDGNNMQQITVEDLMTPLQTTTGFGSLRKRMQQLEKKGVVLDAPLPNAVQERLSRKAGYEKANEEISKWQEIVKKNREAASLVFTQRPDLTAVSTAELVSKFEPVTGLEKEVASLLQENGLVEESSEAGTSLGFNKLTMSEVKERQERLAKMRTMLSYHEAKAKRMKKIKSKAFHRLLQKDRKGKAGVEDEFDAEALKEAAIKAEFKRAQERMTLKHKNTSKWAKRIIQRGLKAKEDGSREALAEQLRTHTALTRKIHAVDSASSSDDSSDEMGADSDTEDANGGLSLSVKPRAKVLAKAKVETLKVLEGDAEAEIPTTGLFSLPFMARAIEKKRKQAQNEAMAVLEQLEQLEYNVDGNEDLAFGEKETTAMASTGRLGFGDMAKLISNGNYQEPDMLVEGSSSDEAEFEADHVIPRAKKTPVVSKKRKTDSNGSIDKICNGVASQAHKLRVTEEAWINGGVDRAKASNGAVSQLQVAQEADISLEDSEAGGSISAAVNPWLYGDLNGNEENVAIERVGGQRVGMSLEERSGSLVTSASIVTIAGAKKKVDKNVKGVQNGGILDLTPREEAKQMASSSSSDSEEDENEEAGKPGFRLSTEIASQAELIQRAFAGDDVEADFEQMKNEALSEEVPMGEAALNLPGWGQWTDVQKRKGPPLWMVKQQEELKRSRDQALGRRKDFKLKHVIISERMDKKAEKFLAPALPFPFQSRDVFEKSMRMPLGREFNTDQVFRDMIRPAVVKDAGVIIDPIKYKMSDAKVGESNWAPEEKKKSEKRANGPRFKRS